MTSARLVYRHFLTVFFLLPLLLLMPKLPHIQQFLEKLRILTRKLKMSADTIDVYTDGSCRNNGRAGAKAGIGVFFGPNHPLNVSKPIEGNRITNNAAEIQAATEAVRIAYDNGYRKIRIHADSEFVIKSINEWMPKWKLNGWLTAAKRPVKNREDFEKLDSALKKMDSYEFVRLFLRQYMIQKQ